MYTTNLGVQIHQGDLFPIHLNMEIILQQMQNRPLQNGWFLNITRISLVSLLNIAQCSAITYLCNNISMYISVWQCTIMHIVLVIRTGPCLVFNISQNISHGDCTLSIISFWHLFIH